jgi:uncharacterized protein YndB with AHSA1/START domain
MAETQSLHVELRGEREIVITRLFAAPRHLVFRAHSEPEIVRRWLLGPSGWTMPVCEIDFRVGGRYRYVWLHADGREMGMGGVYRDIAAPERIVQTELFDEDWTGGEVVSTLLLTEQGGKTLLTNVALYASREARDRAIKSGMTRGIEAGYRRLDEILAEQAA